MLSQVSGLFFIEFAAGTLSFMVCMPLRSLKATFFALNGGISFLFLILFLQLSGLLHPQEASLNLGQVLGDSIAWPVYAALIFLIMSYVLFLLGRDVISRALLAAGTVLLFAALFARGLAGMDAAIAEGVRILGGISLMLSALLLGVCYGTMILGHWYLVAPELPFKYLIASSRSFIVVATLRSLFVLLIVPAFLYIPGWGAKGLIQNLLSFDGLGMFFLMRIFWGLIGPLVLSWMILETAKIRHNQAATGILYVACIFVFIGELCADYIFYMGALPV